MQDKNKLDDMAKKYKEEMMRIYSKNRTAKQSEQSKASSKPSSAAVTVPEKTVTQSTEKPQNQMRTVPKQQTTPDISMMPMPEIPMNYGTGAEKSTMAMAVNRRSKAPKKPQKKSVPQDRNNSYSTNQHTSQPKCSSKFPTADEILQAEKHMETDSVFTVATISSDARFEPAENQRHNQGNYNYDADEPLEELEDYVEDIIPDIDYPDDDTDFEDLFDDDDGDDRGEIMPDMKGTGYLQVEVTTGDGAVPVEKAAVIVTKKIGGQSYLVTMKLTDRSGATDVIPLPAPSESFSEAPDPSERPFSEYNVTVYKKDFYVVPEITVPIFDTIKSIQPVALIPLAEYDLQGTPQPNGTMNGGAANA